LKRLKPSAARRLLVAPLGGASVPSEARPHRVTCCDSLRGLESLGDARLTLAYLDPPYNARQYSTNYHLLETIARWDLSTFRPRGFTGLRPAEELRSDFCRRGTVRHAFSAVFERLQSDWVLFSYNDEGLVPEAELLALISDRYELVTVERSPYRRFRADQDHAARKYARSATHELLILARSPAARVATRSPGSRELHTGPN
jgi:adenine-specific DNA-methyltransferase